MIHSQLSSEAQCSISEVEKISKIFVLEKKNGSDIFDFGSFEKILDFLSDPRGSNKN